MLEKKSEEILDSNAYLNKRKKARKHIKFNKDKRKVFIFSFIVSFISLVLIYFVSPFSDTYRISILNNIYLKDADIRKIAQVNDKYLLNLPSVIKKRLAEHPLIRDAEVKLDNNKTITISVEEEKLIGYIFEYNELYVVTAGNTSMKIDDESIYLIDNVPLIEGYSSEELKEISRGFKDTDPEVIKQISEIHKYPVSYDDKQMEVIMKDGNYCFMSYLALNLLENYYAVSSSIDKSKGYACIYFDEFTNSAYASICPWQSTEEGNQ